MTSPPARPPLSVPLWPGNAHPAMRLVFPAAPSAPHAAPAAPSAPHAAPAAPSAPSAPRPALLVFRGGGYARDNGSGGGAAEWAAAQGLVGIEVEYATRASGESYPRPFDDAARAVRLVRARAAEYGIDPRRVGVLGFSAGGHLATLLSTQPDAHTDPEDDLGASVSPRPDLVALAYPLISFVDGYAPGAYVGSTENFFGHGDVDEATRRRFSSELQVAPGHPPVFVWTTRDDALVPYTHATLFAAACERAGVPVELIVYPSGPHGLGLAESAPAPVREWPARFAAFLRAHFGAF